MDCDQDQFQDVRIWFLIRLLSFIPIIAEVEFVKCFTQARFLNVPREGVKKGIFYGLAESTIFYTNAIRDNRNKFRDCISGTLECSIRFSFVSIWLEKELLNTSSFDFTEKELIIVYS